MTMVVERCVDICWRGKEIKLSKNEEKNILKRLREVMSISQLLSLRKVNAKELKETVELVNSMIHNLKRNEQLVIRWGVCGC